MNKQFTPEDILTGEKFQELCQVSISKLEHKDFESPTAPLSIDVDQAQFVGFDNPPLVYCNSALFNKSKPKLLKSSILTKLKRFKNKFSLVLHNSDQDFTEDLLDIFEVPNLENVYTQNCSVNHERVFPLPIGLANQMWEFGDLEAFVNAIGNLPEKTQSVYFNFTVEGGRRPEYRVECYEAAQTLNIPESKGLAFEEYLQEISTYKFCLCPSGNGLDTYRLWECLYLKVVPIMVKSVYSEHFAKIFPVLMLDKWEDLNLGSLDEFYGNVDWSSRHLLKFNEYCKHIGLI